MITKLQQLKAIVKIYLIDYLRYIATYQDITKYYKFILLINYFRSRFNLDI